MKISLSERILITKYHKLEREKQELQDKLNQYRASFETMKGNITELKELNKILTNQISYLSSKTNPWPK